MNIEEIKTYLPKYLSPQSNDELFDGLKDFPYNLDSRFYTTALKSHNILFQGDGLEDLMVINLPDSKISNAKCIIISNTCDTDLENSRMIPINLIYAPIIELNKYINLITKFSNKSQDQIKAHIESIKQQKITQILYLPQIENVIKESIVFLDKINNINNSYIDRTGLSKQRIFTLSNYGFYVFLLKISIHFTRIRENVDRVSSIS